MLACVGLPSDEENMRLSRRSLLGLGPAALLLHLALVQVIQAVPDYCQISTCPGGSHTGCKFQPGAGPSAKCSKDANTLSDSERGVILSTHNQLRQKLAAGEVSGAYC